MRQELRSKVLFHLVSDDTYYTTYQSDSAVISFDNALAQWRQKLLFFKEFYVYNFIQMGNCYTQHVVSKTTQHLVSALTI